MKIMTAVLDVLWPARCQVCGRDGGPVCARCWVAPQLRSSTPASPADAAWHRVAVGVDALWWAWAYRDTWVERALPRMKYRGDTAAREQMLQAAAAQVAPALPHGALLVPIPQPWWRALRRGRTMAWRYARALHALRPDLRFAPQVLRRTGFPARQAALPRAQRLLAPHGTFAAVGAVVAPVVLVDDVTTTGATLAEAALMLRRAGAQQVSAAVIAH